jgi:hypothetical protein
MQEPEAENCPDNRDMQVLNQLVIKSYPRFGRHPEQNPVDKYVRGLSQKGIDQEDDKLPQQDVFLQNLKLIDEGRKIFMRPGRLAAILFFQFPCLIYQHDRNVVAYFVDQAAGSTEQAVFVG